MNKEKDRRWSSSVGRRARGIGRALSPWRKEETLGRLGGGLDAIWIQSWRRGGGVVVGHEHGRPSTRQPSVLERRRPRAHGLSQLVMGRRGISRWRMEYGGAAS